MLSVEMKEKQQQRSLNLNSLDIMMEQFIQFLVGQKKLITNIRRYVPINSHFNDRIAFAALKFTMEYARHEVLEIKDAASHSTNASGPLAQIVLWKWEGGSLKIGNTITLNRGGRAEVDCDNSPSIVIRILKKREVIEK
uniref:Uncharacterized protein n=1 Tax=Globodera pallida TaxID=36090 RepID=A0A183CKF0_GLOPA